MSDKDSKAKANDHHVPREAMEETIEDGDESDSSVLTWKSIRFIIVGSAILTFFLFWLGFLEDRQPAGEAPTKNAKPDMKDPMKKPMDTATIVHVDLDNDTDILELLLSASVNLVILQNGETMEDVTGDFCHVNFQTHKQDPASVHMFRHIIRQSPDCSHKRYRVNIQQFAKLARQHDKEVKHEGDKVPKALQVGGFVFHQSRCGSTLVANSLIAMAPDKHRVYSEAAPENAASFCGEFYDRCPKDEVASLLRDVIYLMSRTSNPSERFVFFKFHAGLSRHLPVFGTAFPNIPWAFIHRDPVQVLVSHMKEGRSIARCLRERPSQAVLNIIERKGIALKSISKEGLCAATLASYVEAAIGAHGQSRNGIFINYDDLPDVLPRDIFPKHFGLDVTDKEVNMIEQTATLYSKGGDGRSRVFQPDVQRKEEKASGAIRDAARIFLQEHFETMNKP